MTPAILQPRIQIQHCITLIFSCTATATTLVLPRDHSYPIHAPRFATDIVWRVHAQNTSYVRPSDGGKVL